MSDVLSADAIADLFAAAKDGTLPEAPPSARRAASVSKIDFSRPMKLSLLEQRRFEQAHAAFCEDAAARLSAELRAPIEFEVINSSQLTWESALRGVPQASILGIASCSPGEDKIAMCVEEALCLRMVERMLGGSFTDRPATRTLTQIDLALSRHIFSELVGTLSSVWQSLLGLDLEFIELESHSTGLELVPPSQPTLELTIEAHDHSSSSTIVLLVPYNAIEHAGKHLGASKYAHGQAGGLDISESVRSVIGPARVQVRAEVGEANLTIDEVLALGKGDIVRLGAAGVASITVGETPLLSARPGLSGKRRAVQIVEQKGAGA